MAATGWQNFLPAGLGTTLTVKESVITVGTSGDQLCGPDPNRVGLIISSDASAIVSLASQLGTLANGGLALTTEQPVFRVHAGEGLLLPALAWYAKVATGTVPVYVLELLTV